MALIDRLQQTEEPTLPAHEFTDTLILWAEGEITRAQVIAVWDIQAAEEASLDAIKAVYVGLGPQDKLMFADRLERALRMLQLRKGDAYVWSKAAFSTYIGL